jgi:uncharacterized protein
MPKDLVLLKKVIGLGESAQLSLKVAHLHTRTMVEVPVIVERAKEDGPVLLLVGGIHGDEINGVEVVRQIVSKKINKPKYGTVICIPVLNIFGFISKSRYLPDGKDLNRSFPGSKTGSLASRFAFHLMKEIIPHVDYCIDFHTGGAERFNAPQIRVTRDNAELMELAKVFGTDFILYAPNREKSLRESAVNLGKKMILFEGGKSLNINETVTKKALIGTMRFMQHIGMRDFKRQLKDADNPELRPTVLITSSAWKRANYSGMFRSYIHSGDWVEKGQKIGSISDPYGAFEHIVKAPHAGYAIGVNHAAIVHQGDAIFHIGTTD